MKASVYNALAIGIVVTTICLLTLPALATADAGTLDGTWDELTTSGGPPADRGWHSAIYDPVAHRMIIFAGWSGSAYNSRNDTWALDLSTNTWSQISTTGGPPATRAAHVGVYDSSRHRMVIYGGHNWWTSWRNDTWALDLSSNTWTQLSTTGGPPPARHSHGGFYDSARDRLIVFGGNGSGGSLNDTWSLDFSTDVWTQISTTGGTASPRQVFASAYDETNDRVIISSGWGGSDETWALDLDPPTPVWSQMASTPYAFAKVGTGFDNATGLMIIVGGEYGIPADSMAVLFDVRSNTWFDVNVPGAAPPIRTTEITSAIFDPVGQRTIMFGGGTSLSTTFNDTWELLLTGQGDCCTGDLDQDGDVDLADFAIFQSGFTGPQ